VDDETKLKGLDVEGEPKSEVPVADVPAVPNREALLLLLSENEVAGGRSAEFSSCGFGC